MGDVTCRHSCHPARPVDVTFVTCGDITDVTAFPLVSGPRPAPVTFVTLIRPIAHLPVITAAARPPGGAGDAYTPPPARRWLPIPARLPARLPPAAGDR